MELLEIEKELKGPDGRAALERYDRVFVALAERCRAAMDAGMAPPDFQRCEPLADAVTVARKLLRIAMKERE